MFNCDEIGQILHLVRLVTRIFLMQTRNTLDWTSYMLTIPLSVSENKCLIIKVLGSPSDILTFAGITGGDQHMCINTFNSQQHFQHSLLLLLIHLLSIFKATSIYFSSCHEPAAENFILNHSWQLILTTLFQMLVGDVRQNNCWF